MVLSFWTKNCYGWTFKSMLSLFHKKRTLKIPENDPVMVWPYIAVLWSDNCSLSKVKPQHVMTLSWGSVDNKFGNLFTWPKYFLILAKTFSIVSFCFFFLHLWTFLERYMNMMHYVWFTCRSNCEYVTWFAFHSHEMTRIVTSDIILNTDRQIVDNLLSKSNISSDTIDCPLQSLQRLYGTIIANNDPPCRPANAPTCINPLRYVTPNFIDL